MKATRTLFAATLLCMPAALLAGPGPQYSARFLDPNVQWGGLNDLGQVAGTFNEYTVLIENSDGSEINLGNLPDGGSYPRVAGLNNSGQVAVAWSGYTSDQGFLFSTSLAPNSINIGFYPNAVSIQAYGINNAGQIVGFGYANSFPLEAFTWDDATGFTVLTPPSGALGWLAVGINDSGIAVGQAENPSLLSFQNSPQFEACVFYNGSATYLGTLPGASNSTANAINSSGKIVGAGNDASETQYHALLFSGGSVQDLGNTPDASQSPYETSASFVNDAGTIVGWAVATDNREHTWVYAGGSPHDLNGLTDHPEYLYLNPLGLNNRGQILVFCENTSTNQYGYAILTPFSNLTVNVLQRMGLGPVPDGTHVTLLNNDGTALITPTSGNTTGGMFNFTNPPAPTAPNTSYEVKVSPPPGSVGLPAVQHNVALGSATLYYTGVQPYVVQTLSAVSPVAFANATIGGVTTYTGLSGLGKTVFLPDGVFGCQFSMSPGVPCNTGITLGPNSSPYLKPQTGYAQFCVHLTRVSLTARTSNGHTYIPTSGVWSISPGGISTAATGHATSPAYWLPNGAYDVGLSGAPLTGSAWINLGAPIASGVFNVPVGSGSS